MCLVIFAHQTCPGYPLVLAANRDEFHARETDGSSFWAEHPEILAGRDLKAGGTWMGMTRTGRFAAITNYRDPSTRFNAPRSRGELPLDFLIGDSSAQAYLDNVATRAQEYAGFNLLLGDTNNLWYYSNRPYAPGQTPPAPLKLQPGLYGLSNASLDTPWPKVELGKQKLNEILDKGPWNHDDLLSVVSNREQASVEALNLQGIESEMEQLLSAQFILAGDYGTRSSTTMWIDDQRNVSWRELGFTRQGGLRETSKEDFELSISRLRQNPLDETN
ncbi:MAG: hypothetical protein ACI8QT_001413 [Halioglobus sp.]|jgi:uncharacterized protein with NRDE domain